MTPAVDAAVEFAAADVLATPTTPGGPHGHDGPGEHLGVALTWSSNLSGHPAVRPVRWCDPSAGVTRPLV